MKQNDEIKERRMVWWREAKFGMFVHWGLYAIPAGMWKGKKVSGIGEWIMYRDRIPIKDYAPLAKRFNPVKFNAREWVRVAKNAGMRWIVITAKHHDGFCMFDTKLTDYNIVKATPFKHDPLKDLARACEEEDWASITLRHWTGIIQMESGMIGILTRKRKTSPVIWRAT